MIKNFYQVIGVMSGTSLDGVDMVYAKFVNDINWGFEILFYETIPYPNFWKQKLTNLVQLSKEELDEVDIEYTQYLSNLINDFIAKNEIKTIDAICSHGHTALHRPDLGYTVQIGNRKELAKLTKNLVVCDFRVQDVKLGGQGAPLVPIGDELLFSDYEFCLNLGGFANISTNLNGKRLAYDICPVNIVLNKYAEKLGKSYDEGGKLASQGVLNEQLFSKLNSLPFYIGKPPKSLGLEWVNQFIFPILEASNETPKNILRTFVEHIALQLGNNLSAEVDAKVLVTGGGAYNTFLMERLSSLTKSSIVIPDNNLIEYKEALIFALLGILKLRNEVNCLSSVTGAYNDHSSGMVYQP